MPRLSSVKGLIKHPRSRHFWFRRTVPEDLRSQAYLGKREIKFSLNTSDLRKAELLAAQHWVSWSHRFDDLRHGRKPTGLVPTKSDFAELAVWWRDLWEKVDDIEEPDCMVVSEELGDDGKINIVKRDLTASELAERRNKRLVETEKMIHAGEASRLEQTAIGILKERGFSTDRSVVEQFLPVIAEAEYDAYRIQSNRARGAASLEILRRDPMEYVSTNVTVEDLLEEYLKSNKPRAQTEAEWRIAFRRLFDLIGNKAANQVSKHDIRRFTQAIEKMPSRAPKLVRGLPVQEAIEIADRGNLPRVSVETVRKHITAIRAVFAWGVTNEMVSSNPAVGMAPRRKPSTSERLPFDHADIGTIFAPDAYEQYAKNTADFWIPLIGLFTGARLEEIAQLHVADVRHKKNVPVIEISPNAHDEDHNESKRVKNQSSHRLVPVHAELLQIGLMKFIDVQRELRETRLFPNLNRNVNARLGSSVGQKFSRHLRSIGITDQRKVFHSFRHMFKDACRDAGLYEDVHDQLTGHSSSSVGRSYGQGHDVTVLQTEINKINFPELPELRWQAAQER